VTVRQIIAHLDRWAPPADKADYDNVGLQVGDPEAEASRVLVALDLTDEVLDEAERIGADLVVTHHPLLFRPLKALTPQSMSGRLALRLAQKGIAYYTSHTNLDAQHGGVSFALAERLGVGDLSVLAPAKNDQVKLVTFVPQDAADRVREAMAEAGAGHIGDYTGCAFTSDGTGHFTPGDDANPAIGEAGGPAERVEEVRIEVEVGRGRLPGVLAAMREAHPYETPAFDVYALETTGTRVGFGAVGDLEETLPMPEFLTIVAERLHAGALRWAGDERRFVRRVAVCGGSGSSLIGAARRAGADAFVTADLTYHQYFDAAEGRPMALVDAGHYETERVTERLLVGELRRAFPDLDVVRTERWTGPMRTFMGASGSVGDAG
jgi:dinuclear metal center YbgI/SA1388 family protein